MAGVVYHILGSGMVTPGNTTDNPIMLARLQPVLEVHTYQDTAVLYGRQQPDQPMSEAASYKAYLEPLLLQGGPTLVTDERPKSVSETMAIVAGYIRGDFQAYAAKDEAYGPDARAHMRPHRVVMNWPYMPRTRFLLWRQWRRMYPDVPWSAVRNMVAFEAVGGTFVPAFKQRPVKAVVAWLGYVAFQEVLRCVKAVVDPFDTNFNQKREWSGYFRKIFRMG